MLVRRNLFIPSKVRYVRGDKPDVPCILCGIVERSELVQSLEIFRSPLFCVSANLYPYSPGHLLLFPIRHFEDVRDMSEAEAAELFHLQNVALEILDNLYSPGGYNIGYNLGRCGGNSIAHLHLHIVPRFRNELGFADIIGNGRIIVDDPVVSLPRLRDLFASQTRVPASS